MFVVDVFSLNGKHYAVCTGPEINKSMDPKYIQISDKHYKVKSIHFFEGFIGVLQAGFELEGPLPIPIGEAIITS